MTFVKYFRAWLAFLVLQSFGSAFTLYTNSTSASIFNGNVEPFARRSYALVMILLAVSRLTLIGSFTNFSLHLCHIILSSCFTCYFLFEMLYFKVLRVTPANTITCCLNGLTAIVFLVYASWGGVEEPKKEVQRRSGRLFAKHYMEGDLLAPPDTPEIRELKKRV